MSASTEVTLSPDALRLVDLAQARVVESARDAAATQRHGEDHIVMTYYAGELKQVKVIRAETIR